MRSSKSRSRNKSNRNRSVGNVVNRVFDSSGPEGKVRGTPQQIIDKYTQLARDAQLGNDRVSFENFQQHAEHYQRMLNEAQREQEARREEHERQNRERQSERDRDRGPRDGGGSGGGARDRDARQGAEQQGDPGRGPQPDIIDPVGTEDSGLVETPETKDEGRGEGGGAPRKPARKPRSRKPSKSGGGGGDGGDGGNGGQGGDKGKGGTGGKGGDGGPDLSADPSEAAE
ncbi:DUF4167 domain-containing protein [Roseovarius ramblicola]|uniref:DUF4167 domain-containing protein n=1 Tax=Roseovarius ramblicola TaxID=2022336 RepID=A0ABV5HUU9_9RHOB